MAPNARQVCSHYSNATGKDFKFDIKFLYQISLSAFKLMTPYSIKHFMVNAH